MWWLIKGSFWFSLVLILIPLFSTASSERLANAPPMEMADAFSAVTGAYAYVTNICADKPDVCDKGAKTFTALGYRAKEGARLAFDYLNEKFADKPGTALASTTAKPAAERVATSQTPAAAETGSFASVAALLATAADAEKAVTTGAAAQPMPGKPAPYRPPVADKVVTGTVPSAGAALAPSHIPVPLPRPQPDA